jgi:two-component system, chemotaxis family, sensor kinase CheA
MAAGAHEPAYEIRYLANVDELDHLIHDTIALMPDPAVVSASQSTDAANQRLVAMETHSFELDHQGRYLEALRLLEGEDYRKDKAIYAGGMVRAFVLLEELTAARRLSVDRWAIAMEVSALASLAMLIGAFIVEQDRRRRVADHAADLEGTVDRRTAELASRNQAMRLVLDTVQQGLVGIDAKGWMASERSAVLTRWFGAGAAGQSLVDYLRPHDPSFAAWLEIGLAQLSDGAVPASVAIEQLPARLRAGERTIAVEYEQIPAGGILVIMSDITAALERERVDADQRDFIAVLETIARDRVGFFNFLDDAGALVRVLRGTSDSTTARLLHTLKGNTAQFGLTALARLCHELEEQLGVTGELSARDRELLGERWDALTGRITSLTGRRAHPTIEVDRTAYQKVVELALRRADPDELLRELVEWDLDPVAARLERLADAARGLAERIGKPELEVVVEAGGLRVDNRQWASLWGVCVHLIRNAVDHGIELPTGRAAAGKPAAGRIMLGAALEDDAFVVRIHDDGAGIDWETLARRAASLGLPFASETEQMIALFSDGVSACVAASEISGRGVGLAALRDEVERRGGRIAVESERGRGTTFALIFPGHALHGTRVAEQRRARALAISSALAPVAPRRQTMATNG